MQYNDDIIYNKAYLIILPKNKCDYFKYIDYTFKNTILFDSRKDTNNLISFIKKNNFKQIVFVDYVFEYYEIINHISKKIPIKFLLTNSLGGFSDSKIYSEFKAVIELYKLNRVSSIGVLDKNLYDMLTNKKINCFQVILDVPREYSSYHKKMQHTVGILSDQNKNTHSFYNSMSSLIFDNYIAKILNVNSITKKFARVFNIKYKNCNNKQSLINNNEVNLYVNFTDNKNHVFIESMDSGVPCILGNNSILMNEYLRESLIVNSDDDINEISNKINSVIKNKSKIMKEYKKNRHLYSDACKKSARDFLECEVDNDINVSGKKLLSIVIPVYNTEKYLQECLKSVLKSIPKSIIKNTEILIINDGSKDDSESIIIKYKNNYPKLINYIKQKNHGLGNVRNVALKNAKGKYIASVDSDDTIDKNFFKSALKYMNKNIDLIMFDWLSVTDESTFQTPAIEGTLNNLNKYEGLLYSTIMPSSCNKIIKKSLYDELQIKFLEDKYEDLSANPFILLRANTIKYINKPYYKYYIRSGSIMRSSAGYSMINVLKEVNSRLYKYRKYINVDVNKLKYYIFSWRIEEFIFNQMYELNDNYLDEFINYVYNNLYEVILDVFNSKYYLKMLSTLDSDMTHYIAERNEFFKNKKIKNFIKLKSDKKMKLNAYIIYYGKKS